MQNTGVNGGAGRVRAEDVISKLKDDGDFDRLRLKIIRKLKENEELRSSIISMVQQSAALNRPGVENLKPRQLSDAIHQEIGDKVMSHISDGVWNVIRSADGMKNEITETVQSVYDKLSNPSLKDNGESSSHRDSHSPRNKRENHGEVAEAIGNNGVLSDGEPNEPPGFGSADVNKINMNSQKNRPDNNSLSAPHGLRATGKHNGDSLHVENISEAENMDCDAPPGFPSIIKHENSGDAGDEDPDVPPGFG
ncbi:Unknown protein [Striga hermonthica]|uniref:BOD1/SHG1 domain-containing protein n=1 Tax=Striga hermonthica TaxID=68872 RepID=A0A9N7NMP4_STRHE|nr:Unknown protein [Striga hermonthica]